MAKAKPIQLKLEAGRPEGKLKSLGGSRADEWNNRIQNLTVNALPMAHSDNTEAAIAAIHAVAYGTVDMAPTDPIEGILIAQLIAASEASLAMYSKGWAQPVEYFAARTKYLQLADKAARTVVMLTERLDHHRGRGQQQITVKHVTTNNVTADQAIIAESVTTGGGAPPSPALLAVNSAPAIAILDQARQPALIGGGGSAEKK